jgi:hypothetical protein
VTGLDHVFLQVGSKTVLRAEERCQVQAAVGCEPVGDVSKLAVNGRRIADDSDSTSS